MAIEKQANRDSRVGSFDASSDTSGAESNGVTPLFALNALAIVFMAGTALAAALTRDSRISSIRLWTTVGILFVVLATLTRTRIRFRQHLLSFFSGVAMAVVTVVHLLRGTDSSLYPTSGSVDVTLHYALLQYIFYNGRVPIGGLDNPAASFLDVMVVYPYGAHVNAGVVAGALNVQPLVAMTLFVYLVMALSVTVLLELTMRAAQHIWPRMSEGAAVSVGIASVVAFLAVPRYVEGMVMLDYFFAQVVGIYLILVFALGLQEYFTRGSRVGLGLSSISSLLLTLTYPVYCLIPVATVGLILLARHGWRWREWGAILPVMSGVILGLLVFLPGRMSLGLAIIDHEGGSATPSISALGGPVVIALFVLGLSVAVTALRRRRGAAVGVLLATTLVATLQLAGMYVLESTVGIGSYYMVRKLVYVVCWLALPLVAVGVFAVGSAILKKRLLRSPRSGVYMASGLVIFALGWVTFLVPEVGAVPIIDPDSYAVAERARSEIDGLGQFAMSEGGTKGFMLYVGVMNQTWDSYAYAVLNEEYDLVQQWLASPEKRFLVTTNAPSLAEVIEERGLKVIFQQGSAAVIAKPD